MTKETLVDDIYAPEWIKKASGSLKRDDSSLLFEKDSVCISGTPATRLENLSDPISALIISHLSLEEIARLSLVSKCLYKACRSQELWKHLMTYRWNLKKRHQEITDFYGAYRNAHQHPHDLWITHWNIVFPCDGLAPGRCCIPEERESRLRRQREGSHRNPLKSCPVCRNWNEVDDNCVSNHSMWKINTPAQSMALTTYLTRQKCMNPPENLDRCTSTYAAQKAFACAGTFHRTLKTNQYKVDSTSFLTDLLFFNITDSCTEEGQWELNQLLQEALSVTMENGIDRSPARDPMHETSHHSWYICRLSNPDFYRPLVYQTGIQRPECFAVYPSEGYIEPGGSIFLTVGIRPLGSALAYAFDALNVQREGLPAAWADLYTEEAHLPMAPILIRYKFATVHPTRADDLHDPRRSHRFDNFESTNTATNLDSTRIKNDKGSLLEYYWKQPTEIRDLRTIRLSVHVHSNYSLSDFSRSTCQPWNWESYNSGPMFSSPELRENYFQTFSKLNNSPGELERGQEDSMLSQYRLVSSHTEEPCLECGRSWGLREEELAQAYFVYQNDTERHIEKRRLILHNSFRCLVRMSNDGIFGNASRHSQLLVAMTNVLHSIKAAPWSTTEQKQKVLQMEAIVDNTCRQISAGTAEEWAPWRHAGIYRFALCTDSVFQGPNLENYNIDTEYKDEPEYLDAFRHLAHSPGHYCLGPQEDPNHLSEPVVASSKRYGRIQKSFATDVFMDNPVFAFQAGICMIRDPRSLLVHGIYDRIRYPGTVIRRPRACSLVSTKPEEIRTIFSRSCGSPTITKAQQSYYALQEYLDVDTITMVRSHEKADESEVRCRSLIIYSDGIPPPGVGQFPLSQRLGRSETRLSNPIAPLEIDDDEQVVQTLSQSPEQPRGSTLASHQREPVGLVHDRGPQILRLLWVLGAQLGLAVIDSPDVASVFVDRTILIASQWVSISLMAAPLFWTLCARYARLIPTQPIDYSLEDLPFQISNKMRFLTEKECGYFAIIVLIVWLSLGRWTERHVGRDFFRAMLEHVTPDTRKIENMTPVQRLRSRVFEWFQRRWDFCCPLFLQRRVFAPHWNRRSRDDLIKHIAFWKSQRVDEERKYAQPRNEGLFEDRQDSLCEIGWNNHPSTKIVVGSIVALFSFCSSSPLFGLNLVTIFSCSISLGMSISLHSMEKGRPGVNLNSTDSLLKSVNLATIVILAFLVGQLVGSSGGTLFLAEFVVTSISLILGGAGTISTGAMESWGCFFCLSSTAFWGYLFGRVALMDGVRQKRGGYSSILLSKAVLFLFFFWGLIFCVVNFSSPASLIVASPQVSVESKLPRDELAAKLLQ